MNPIGIMQGRLVPPVNGKIQCFPRDNWADEFPRAAEAGLAFIEWIFDLHGLDVNPLGTDAGIAYLGELKSRHQVDVRSVCADYFMDRPFVGATSEERREREQNLEWLIGRAALAGVRRIVLPFVDQSSMRTPADRALGLEVIRAAVPAAQRAKLELHLETDLAPADFAAFLATLPADVVKVNYDSGNSASLGYHPKQELLAYGDHIGSVHIKDRMRGGTTVPLGLGHAEFSDLFAGLAALRYAGDFVLQVARGAAGQEVPWAARNRSFIETHWSRVSNGLVAGR